MSDGVKSFKFRFSFFSPNLFIKPWNQKRKHCMHKYFIFLVKRNRIEEKTLGWSSTIFVSFMISYICLLSNVCFRSNYFKIQLKIYLDEQVVCQVLHFGGIFKLDAYRLVEKVLYSYLLIYFFNYETWRITSISFC